MKTIITLSVLCLALSSFCLAGGATSSETQTMLPEAAGCGELLWPSPTGFLPLPLVNTEVSISVTGPLVSGTIKQEFTNPTDETIEALYVFPLPEGAAVEAMELLIGERRIISIVQEKAQARRTYEQAKAEGKKAALVESLRPNLFTTSVAGIEPGQKVTVKLKYLDQAEFSGGSFQLAFPLTFTPRYFPSALLQGGDGGPAQAATQVDDDAHITGSPFLTDGHPAIPRASIAVTLQAGIPLEKVTSASHEISSEENGAQIFINTCAESIAADRDFLLSWTPRQGTAPLTALFTETREDGRYGLLMVVPSIQDNKNLPAIPTETLFLVDVSGSMSGASIRQARTALHRAVDRLGPGDHFNLMAFNNDSHLWQPSFQEVNSANVDRAHLWIRALAAENGTEMHGALLRAMTQFLHRSTADKSFSRRIILITDAAIGNEDQLLRDTADKLGPVRLHVVGIGSSPNRFLVKRLASQGGGLSAFVNENATAGEGMDGFLKTINRPQISNQKLTWLAAQPGETFPARLPELYAGELLLWSGEFPIEGEIQGLLTANSALGQLEIPLHPVAETTEHNGTAVRWARLKVDEQMARLYSGADQEQIRREIIAVGLKFGLVTRFTSRVAVEELVTTSGHQNSHRLANALPSGSVLPRGGTWTPLLRLVGWLTLILGLTLLVVQKRNSGGRS